MIVYCDFKHKRVAAQGCKAGFELFHENRSQTASLDLRSNVEGYYVSDAPTLLVTQNETDCLAFFFSHETQCSLRSQVIRKLVARIRNLRRKTGLIECPKLLEIIGPILAYFGHCEPAMPAFPDG